MADETQAGGGTPAEPTSAQNQPPAGVQTATTANGTQAEPTNGNPGSEPMSLDEAKKLRSESASLRKRLAELETREQERQQASLSETEKVTRERDSLREQNAALLVEQQHYRLAREIARHAPSLNLIDPDAALLMLQAGGEIEYDDDGKPSNIAKLLEQLVAAKPYLVVSSQGQGANAQRPPLVPPSSGGASNPARSAVNNQPAASAPDPKALYRNRKGLGNQALWKR